MHVQPETIHVALLAGGRSGEREISLASGKGAAAALRTAGFTVDVLDPASSDDLKSLVEGSFDVAFLCLHGRFGEDGTVQGMLEVMGLPYIGSGVWSSATAMDKAKTKVFYHAADVPTPHSITLHHADEISADQLVQMVGEHCVVKPANEGSALGVSIVTGSQEVDAAVASAFEIDHEVLVETFVAGTELTVAVLGNEDASALPVIEIVPQNAFYDFESKYAPGGSQHICPARLSAEDTEKVQEVAVQAHKALECRGVSRTDIILDSDGNCWALETNTIPGMTETSLLPDAGRAAGIEFPDLCTRLIEFALEDAAEA